MKRVVVTGIGIYSVLGTNINDVTESLKLGKSGIIIDPDRREIGFRSCLTGILERPILKGELHRRERVCLAEQGEYAYISTREALEKANINKDFLEKNEVGIIYGNDSSTTPVIEAIDCVREKKDTAMVGSGSVFKSMNSTVSMNLSVILNLRGINFTVSAACASGAHAIGIAAHLIKSGLQKTIICGGAQELNAFSMGSFDGIGAFSIREDNPKAASRPFDVNRDGLVPSGGAASLILEEYEQAIARGAKIYGEIAGYGFSSNGDHISVPNVDGPTRSLSNALKDAGLDAKAIDYINAHATSTPVGDAAEAQALNNVFGNHNTPISSTKSMTGHEMWMGGASEVIYSILMMHNNFIAPNINFETPDEYSRKLNIINKTQEARINTFLSNSFGFGGTNSSIIVNRI